MILIECEQIKIVKLYEMLPIWKSEMKRDILHELLTLSNVYESNTRLERILIINVYLMII